MFFGLCCCSCVLSFFVHMRSNGGQMLEEDITNTVWKRHRGNWIVVDRPLRYNCTEQSVFPVQTLSRKTFEGGWQEPILTVETAGRERVQINVDIIGLSVWIKHWNCNILQREQFVTKNWTTGREWTIKCYFNIVLGTTCHAYLPKTNYYF